MNIKRKLFILVKFKNYFIMSRKLLKIKSDKNPCYPGSTSWTFNINKLTHHAVENLLKIAYETTRFPLNWKVGSQDNKIYSKPEGRFTRQPDLPKLEDRFTRLPDLL